MNNYFLKKSNNDPHSSKKLLSPFLFLLFAVLVLVLVVIFVFSLYHIIYRKIDELSTSKLYEYQQFEYFSLQNKSFLSTVKLSRKLSSYTHSSKNDENFLVLINSDFSHYSIISEFGNPFDEYECFGSCFCGDTDFQQVHSSSSSSSSNFRRKGYMKKAVKFLLAAGGLYIAVNVGVKFVIEYCVDFFMDTPEEKARKLSKIKAKKKINIDDVPEIGVGGVGEDEDEADYYEGEDAGVCERENIRAYLEMCEKKKTDHENLSLEQRVILNEEESLIRDELKRRKKKKIVVKGFNCRGHCLSKKIEGEDWLTERGSDCEENLIENQIFVEVKIGAELKMEEVHEIFQKGTLVPFCDKVGYFEVEREVKEVIENNARVVMKKEEFYLCASYVHLSVKKGSECVNIVCEELPDDIRDLNSWLLSDDIRG